MRQFLSTETLDEMEISSVVPDSDSHRSTRAATDGGGYALRGRILLQGEVGVCRRVSAAVQEKPLPAAAKAGGDGAHAQGLDGPAALPHDRRRTLGLSCDHCVQELHSCQRTVRRRHAEEATLARPGHLCEGRAEA